MSNFLAIATVTATVAHVIQTALAEEGPGGVPGAQVTTLDPGDPELQGGQPGVNVFLYQSRTNAALRDADLPTRRADGSFVQRPQAALNLEYLLSFYGDERKLEPQRLLGTVAGLLHARPILSRRAIEATIALPGYAYLRTSNLAEQGDLVKFTPLQLTVDQLYNLWALFPNANYVLGATYEATVVLIDFPVTPSAPLPVREARVFVGGRYREPLVERVSGAAGTPVLLPGGIMSIEGVNLKGEVTRVRLEGEQVEPQTVTDTRLTLRLDPRELPWLRAGVTALQVVHLRPLPDRELAAAGESPVFAIVLHPRVVGLRVTTPDLEKPPVLTVEVEPIVGRAQPVALLLNRRGGPAALAYVLNSPGRDVDLRALSFPLPGVVAGDYLVRVQVAGAQSLLEIERDPKNRAFGEYVRPAVSVPAGPGAAA